MPLSVDMKRSIVTRYPKLGNKPIEVIENISEIDRFQKGYDKNISVLSKKLDSSLNLLFCMLGPSAK